MKLSVKLTREIFKEIYQETYNNTLRFIVVKCNNMENINDIIQDTYLELLKIIKKQKVVEVDNINNYVLGIANNIIKRHYYQKKKENIISYYSENEKENETVDPFDLEKEIITKENVSKVWEYVRKKDLITTKIFYLYFGLGLKISDIAKELEIGESNVKNRIYRTLRELKKYLGKEEI